MTITRFVTKSAFRNKRRSILTVLSITFSLLLLTVMMTVWHRFYVDKGDAQSAQRLITRHRVSLTQNMPVYYREKMRTVPGVVAGLRRSGSAACTKMRESPRTSSRSLELTPRKFLR
jgi:cell division protein FtsX